ncbi:proteasome accessory factor PafA2 family protein [Stieleria varia]|uniref:Depupylase n=1 Tax=Stieleria varia TaxID=2528005 RepID=A0A5C5ZQF4_9BACT|nr:proteasome accessory factor PafA2 family protein [Stieleria varia]TWT89436.1 Depupylase [Stieleria varia]
MPADHSVDAAPQRDQGDTQCLVSRLIGLETEYATLVLDQQDVPRDALPSAKQVYEAMCDAIRRDQPTADGIYDREQMFLASGGAVTFESHPSMYTLPGGLVEIATPEVSSPAELLACQRSIDDLVENAANSIDLDIDLRVLKNSSDALGHVYGCQENYEAVVARGSMLLIYRLFVALLWLMQCAILVASLPVLLCLYLAVYFGHRRRGVNIPVDADPRELFETLARPVQLIAVGCLRLIHFPSVVVLRFVCRHIAFRDQRRYLTALLVSRVSLCGSGDLDHDGRYRLSAKAIAVDVVADMGSYRGERPIFVFGHWLDQFCAKSIVSLSSTRSMFAKRQRLQIGLSDSNLCDLAEYVKFASVSLVLDMIEAGATKDLPVLKRPITALHDLASDWNLVTRVPTRTGRSSALDIQKNYLRAARSFVESVDSALRGEAPVVIERWNRLFDAVADFRKDAGNTASALGSVDWLTKLWMLDQLDSDVGWAARKKTDLRYHELSEQGYHRKLARTNPELQLVDPDQIRMRRKYPPPNSRAARRGWVIREFGGAGDSLRSEWGYALWGSGSERKRVSFDRPIQDSTQ